MYIIIFLITDLISKLTLLFYMPTCPYVFTVKQLLPVHRSRDLQSPPKMLFVGVYRGI